MQISNARLSSKKRKNRSKLLQMKSKVSVSSAATGEPPIQQQDLLAEDSSNERVKAVASMRKPNSAPITANLTQQLFSTHLPALTASSSSPFNEAKKPLTVETAFSKEDLMQPQSAPIYPPYRIVRLNSTEDEAVGKVDFNEQNPHGPKAFMSPSNTGFVPFLQREKRDFHGTENGYISVNHGK